MQRYTGIAAIDLATGRRVVSICRVIYDDFFSIVGVQIHHCCLVIGHHARCRVEKRRFHITFEGDEIIVWGDFIGISIIFHQPSVDHHAVAHLYFVLVIKIGVVQVSAILHFHGLAAVGDVICGIVVLNHFHFIDAGDGSCHINSVSSGCVITQVFNNIPSFRHSIWPLKRTGLVGVGFLADGDGGGGQRGAVDDVVQRDVARAGVTMVFGHVEANRVALDGGVNPAVSRCRNGSAAHGVGDGEVERARAAVVREWCGGCVGGVEDGGNIVCRSSHRAAYAILHRNSLDN